MGTFLRGRHGVSYERGFVQGAGRILITPTPIDPWIDGIEDLLILTAGATQYDVVSPWIDVGFTKTGINIARTFAEEEFDVDQIRGAIKRRPNNWEMSVGTQLAEASLETFQAAWQLGPITTVTKVDPQLDERHVGMSAPPVHTERSVAVVFQLGDGTIRAWVFRRCTLAAQESGMTLAKTGEQVSLPARWNAQADPDQPTDTQFGEIFEQIPEP